MADRIKSFQQETNQINILKSIRTDLGATASSYTPDTSVVTKDRVVTYAQAEEELSVLGDIEEGVKQQVADLDIAQKDIKNIKLLLQGNLYDYQTDSNSAYTKSVPAGAMPYASLDEVGGKTVVWNQWWKVNSNSTITDSSGVTIQRNVENDSLTITGTATTYKTIFSVINAIVGTTNDKLVDGHKYAVVFDSQNIGVRLGYEDASENHNSSYIITGNGGYSKALGIIVDVGITYNETIRPMLCDLTLMFGSGNEPTIDEFRAMFPAEYYEATAGTLLSAGVTEVVSKKADTTTIATYPIPAEVRALEGYGWSAGGVFNYIDYENKKFVKRVDRVDLGSVGWTEIATDTEGYSRFVTTSISSVDKHGGEILCAKYLTVSYAYTQDRKDGINLYTNGNVVIYDSAYATYTGAQVATALSGVYAYYELATPQEIDISAYLTDDNLIEVESGGTLTFPNSNGTDYQIPVPSAETYMIDLQASL